MSKPSTQKCICGKGNFCTYHCEHWAGLRHEANAKVTQAERAVLDLVKEWKAAKQAAELLADDPHAWHLWNETVENRLIDAQEALEAAEKERDALNASTVGEERED